MRYRHRILLLGLLSALHGAALAQSSEGELSQPRKKLAATTVGGKALFAGGQRFGGFSDVVDIYDPATSTWTTDALSVPRGALVATAVGDLAFFAGGISGSPVIGPVPRDTVDIYDASSGVWTQTQLSQARTDFAATHAGGKAFFGGGRDYSSPSTATSLVDIYDVATGTWTTSALSRDRFGLAATTAGDLALFAGGIVSTSTSAAVDIYDPSTSTWTTSALSVGRGWLAATSVGGLAFFAGGNVSGDRVDIYDTQTATWSTATLSQPRQRLTATSVGTLAIFAGGYNSDVVDIFDVSTGLWSTGTLSAPRHYLASTSVRGIALFGGGGIMGGTPFLSDVVDLFEPPLGITYCSPAAVNSTGRPGVMRLNGLPFVAAGDVRLTAEQLPPGQVGYFLASRTPGTFMPPGSSGVLCVSGNVGRYNRAQELIQGPSGTLQIDLGAMPVNPPAAVQPGEMWHFQCWYRDTANSNNFTDAVRMTFL